MRIRPHLSIPFSLALSTSLYASSYSLSISADTTRFDYAETEGGHLLDTETNDFGDISGFTLSLEPQYRGVYITSSYSSGDTDYVGGTDVDPTYGSYTTTTRNSIIDYSVGYKTTIPLDPRAGVEMPFNIGLGYRRWLREVQSTADAWGYDEEYDWGYLDIGTGMHFALSRNAMLGFDAHYRNGFGARMYENSNGYTYNLKNVYGYKIAVPLEIALDRSLRLFFLYSYEYWNIGASDPVGGYYEPDSETKNEILSAGLKLLF